MVAISNRYKEINIIAYETVDGIYRIEYKNHIIQTYGYNFNTNNADVDLIHFIIDDEGNDVCEMDCLIKCIIFIDNLCK